MDWSLYGKDGTDYLALGVLVAMAVAVVVAVVVVVVGAVLYPDMGRVDGPRWEQYGDTERLVDCVARQTCYKECTSGFLFLGRSTSIACEPLSERAYRALCGQ